MAFNMTSIEDIPTTAELHVLLVTTGLTLISNLFQSFVQGHFTSKCYHSDGSPCYSVEHVDDEIVIDIKQ